ncbi:MAG: ABC-2 family transporter protein, partial [Turicibacter sp.]|nr:ABC-2 family transporter protein [Turicibacter sp.]
LPTFILVYFVTHGTLTFGINILWFIVSILFSVLINFFIDFITGTICLYTESIWGINIMKQVIVTLFSGAMIPIPFFPESLRKIVNYLPFQAIYNLPLKVLLNSSVDLEDLLHIILIQFFWIVVLFIISNYFWKTSIKIITVNGG